MPRFKQVVFALCVIMANVGQWQGNIHLQMSAIFWIIAMGRWENQNELQA
jgi:hypothetical protein